MTASTTLVLTVGTSPIPVLLSILTHAQAGHVGKDDRIVLLHSGPEQPDGAPNPEGCPEQALSGPCDWAEVAEQARGTDWAVRQFGHPETSGSAAFAGTVKVAARAMLAGDCPPIDCSSVGTDESDMAAITDCLRVLVTDSDKCTWMLDYTGGTAAMSAAAVQWHLSLDDEKRGLRSYVDYTSNLLHLYDGDEPVRTMPLYLHPHFTIDLAAFLHGFALSEPSQTTGKAWAKNERGAIKALKTILKNHYNSLSDPHTRCCEGLIPAEPQVRAWEARASLTAHSLADKEDTFAEFDGVLRWGIRVTTVEVKSNSADLLERAGWRVRAASAVFGPATSSLLVTADDQRDLDLDILDALSSSTGRPLSDVTLPQLEAASTGGGLFHDDLITRTEHRQADWAPPPDVRASDIEGGLLVTASGGQLLATLVALATWRQRLNEPTGTSRARAVVITSQQHVHEELPPFRSLLTAVAPEIELTDTTRTMTDERDVAGATLAWGNTTSPVTLDVTAGTKAATAGLVRARFEAAAKSTMAQATIVATNPRTRIRSTPECAESAPVVRLPWKDILCGLATVAEDRKVTRDLLEDTISQLCCFVRETEHEPQVWSNWNAPLLAPRYCDYWAVTSADRLVLLVAPHTAIHPDESGKAMTKAAEHFAIQADVAIAGLLGDAASTVLVDPFEPDSAGYGDLRRRNPLPDPTSSTYQTRKLDRGARPYFSIDLVSRDQEIRKQLLTARRTIGMHS